MLPNQENLSVAKSWGLLHQPTEESVEWLLCFFPPKFLQFLLEVEGTVMIHLCLNSHRPQSKQTNASQILTVATGSHPYSESNTE